MFEIGRVIARCIPRRASGWNAWNFLADVFQFFWSANFHSCTDSTFLDFPAHSCKIAPLRCDFGRARNVQFDGRRLKYCTNMRARIELSSSSFLFRVFCVFRGSARCDQNHGIHRRRGIRRRWVPFRRRKVFLRLCYARLQRRNSRNGQLPENRNPEDAKSC